MKTVTFLNKSIKEHFHSVHQNWLEYLASVFLWQESIPPKISLFLFAAGRLQLGLIIIWGMFHFTIDELESEILTNFLKKISNTFIYGDLITSHEIYLNGFSLAIQLSVMYIIFLISLIILLLYGFKYQRELKKIETLYCLIGGIHNEIIFWYINLICLKGLNYPTLKYNLYGATISSDEAVSYIILSILILINLIFCMISLVFRYDPFKTENLMSCWKPSCQVMTGLFKAVQSIILICLPKNGTTGTIFWIITLFVITFQKYALHHQFPFYHRLGMNISIVFNAKNLAIGYPAAFMYFMLGPNKSPGVLLVYFEMILLVIGLKISLVVIEKQLSSSIKNLKFGVKKEEEVFKTMQILSRIMEKGKLGLNSISNIESLDEIYFLSIIKIHETNCIQSECVCKHLLEKEKNPLWISDIKHQIHELAFDILFKFFKDSVEKLRNSHRITIYLAYLELLKNDSGRKALVTLLRIPREETSFVLRIGLDKLILRLKSNINKFYNGNHSQEGVLNMADFFTFQQSATIFEEKIEEASRSFVTFWKTLNNRKINANLLLQIDNSFEETSIELERLWGFLLSDFPESSKALALRYSSFLFTMRNSSERATKLFKSYNDWLMKTKYLFNEELITKKTFMHSRNITIYTSMKKESLGNIIDTCTNISMLGYKKAEIIGKSINLLMLNCLQSYHQKALQRHVEENRDENTLHKNFRVFAKIKDGTIIALQAYLAICPQFKDELIYMGIFRPIVGPRDYLIVNKEGAIDGFTKGIIKRFRVENFTNFSLADLFDDITPFQDFFRRNQGFKSISKKSSEKKFSPNLRESLGNKSSLRELYDEFKTKFQVVPKYSMSSNKQEKIMIEITKTIALGTYFFSIEITYEKLRKLKELKEIRNVKSEVLDSYSEIDQDIDEGFELAQPILAKIPHSHEFTTTDSSILKKIDQASKEIQKVKTEEIPKSVSFSSEEDDKNNPFKSLKHSNGSIQSYERKKSLISQIERAIYEVKITKRVKFVYFSILLFGIFTLIFLFTYSFSTKSESQDLQKILQFSSLLNEGLELMIAQHVNVRYLYANSKGFVSSNRYSDQILTIDILKDKLYDNDKKILDLHREYTNLYKHTILADQIIQNKFTFLDKTNNFKYDLDIVEYIKFFVASMDKILKMHDFSDPNQQNINFISKNNINGFVLHSYEIIKNILQSTFTEKNSSKYAIAGLFITVLWGIILNASYIFIERKFIKDQIRLFDALIKISDERINELIETVDPSSELQIGIRSLSTNPTFFSEKSSKEKKDSRCKKEVELHYKTELKAIFSLFFISFLYFSAMIVIQIQQDQKDSKSGLNSMVNSLGIIFETEKSIHLMEPYTIDYILKNSGIDFEVNWDVNYQNAIENLNRMNYIISDARISINLEKLIRGSICEFLKDIQKCSSLDRIYTENGVIGFNNAILNNVETIKSLFDATSKQIPSIQMIMNQTVYLNFEKVYFDIFEDIYHNLISEYKILCFKEIRSLQTAVERIWIIYTVLIVIMTIISYYLIVCPMYKKRIMNRKLLRIVPSKMILANNFLKAYLRDHSGRKLEHFFKKL